MKKFLYIAILNTLSFISYADHKPETVLDKITFQVAAKDWVSTKNPKLSININASLGNEDLVKARANIMTNLNKIAASDWHIVQFNRSQDSSGLDKLQVSAQARVNQDVLGSVYQNVKSISKPGANYSVNAIEFEPSLDEIQKVRANIRDTLYKKASDEIARINKLYSNQHYSIFNLTIVDGSQLPSYPERNMLKTMAVSAPQLTVSNELTMSAIVQLASNRKD